MAASDPLQRLSSSLAVLALFLVLLFEIIHYESESVLVKAVKSILVILTLIASTLILSYFSDTKNKDNQDILEIVRLLNIIYIFIWIFFVHAISSDWLDVLSYTKDLGYAWLILLPTIGIPLLSIVFVTRWFNRLKKTKYKIWFTVSAGIVAIVVYLIATHDGFPANACFKAFLTAVASIQIVWMGILIIGITVGVIMGIISSVIYLVVSAGVGWLMGRIYLSMKKVPK